MYQSNGKVDFTFLRAANIIRQALEHSLMLFAFILSLLKWGSYSLFNSKVMISVAFF